MLKKESNKYLARLGAWVLNKSVQSVGRYFVSASERTKLASDAKKALMSRLMNMEGADGLIVKWDGRKWKLSIEATGGAMRWDADALVELARRHGATESELAECQKATATGKTVKYKRVK